MIWTEKYRPKEFADVIGIDPAIEKLVKGDDMPHFLFGGSPGTGKTTTARIIISTKGVDHLELNASDERGIDTIREKVKTFAMTQGLHGSKIIFLDEADALTKDAQTSLRNLMEVYASNCKFILTANYESKIIPALKSRCAVFLFKNPTKEAIVARLNYICSQEALPIPNEVIEKVVIIYYPDIRKCIGKLQEMKANPSVRVGAENILAQDVLRLLKGGKFEEARQLVLDSLVDPEDLLEEIYNFTMTTAPLPIQRITIHLIADCMKWMPTVINKHILFEDFMLDLMKVLGVPSGPN